MIKCGGLDCATALGIVTNGAPGCQLVKPGFIRMTAFSPVAHSEEYFRRGVNHRRAKARFFTARRATEIDAMRVSGLWFGGFSPDQVMQGALLVC